LKSEVGHVVGDIDEIGFAVSDDQICIATAPLCVADV
jgi:hypothetical protein